VSKNIVICSDGTGQSYAGTDSNVLRLYTLASKKAPQQITCYDPGIGTLPLPTGRTRLGRWIRHLEELSFGVGLIDNLVELYAYLMRHYTPGDRIYLFGFSRGAFTVRALAGMLHVCGLLRPDDEHLLQYAAGIYQTSEHRIRLHRRSRGLPVHQKTPRGAPIDHAIVDDDARRFKSRLAQNCTVAFMGIWDTVKAYGWIWPRSFPALRHNPSVLAVSHAVSLDEQRSNFQMTGWGDRHHRIKEVWFAGDHSDVGGGHPGASTLADASLAWMLGEATHAGLRLDAAHRPLINSIVASSRLAPAAKRHNLKRGCFRLLEICPRFELENNTYLPHRHFTCLPSGVRKPGDHTERAPLRLHESVQVRARSVDGAYDPERLLARSPAFRSARRKRPIVVYEPDRKIIGYDDA
jgi:uncharacterized protein (DUF2235 family)